MLKEVKSIAIHQQFIKNDKLVHLVIDTENKLVQSINRCLVFDSTHELNNYVKNTLFVMSQIKFM